MSNGSFIPAIIAARQRRLVRAFEAAGATTAATASTAAELGIRDSLLLRNLVRRGVLVASAGNRHHLDVEAWHRLVKSRQLAAAIALLAVVLGVLVALGVFS